MKDKCRWCHVCAKEDIEVTVPDHLEQLLPEGHCHCICSYTPLEQGFKASVKLQIHTREEAEKWLEDFQRSSKVTLRVAKTYPITEVTVRRNSYRVDLRCQHNTRLMHLTKKNTNCPAGLYLVLKKHRYSQNRKSRSSDSHVQEGLLLHVTIKHQHNHRLAGAEALQQWDVSKEKSLCEMATGNLDVADTWLMGLESEGEEDCPAVPLQTSTLGEGSRTGEASTQKEHLEGRLRSMFDGLMDRLRQDETFQAPLESLVSTYESIRTDRGLILALSAFGKVKNAAAMLRMKIEPRKDQHMNAQMDPQPTAAAGCKTQMEGRPALTTGLPPKRAKKEHSNTSV